ncbi:MAG: HlyD family secretion protein, partial [Alphaproteobacteria bacterium]|nr:HlyD family secretion protein [Alphaproteobacteria bacterium]
MPLCTHLVENLTMTEDATIYPSASRRLTGFILRLFFLLGVPAIAAVAGLHYYAGTGRHITTENAYVKARKTAISANISARVLAVHVTENRMVKKGDLLLELDRSALEAEMKEAEADLEVVRLDIAKQRAALKRARVDIGVVKEDLRYAEVEYFRQAKLAETGSGRAINLDSAIHEVETARQEFRLVEADIRELITGLGGKENTPDQDMPAWKQAMAVVNRVKLSLSWTSVLAPSDGIVVKATVRPGEFVTRGKAIFVLVDQQHPWLEANLKETQLERLTIGMPGTIVLDAWPDHILQARVVSVAPATGAEFALLPPQNASGNWVKVVQRLPVRLEILPSTNGPELRAGMTAEVRLDTGQERVLHPRLE